MTLILSGGSLLRAEVWLASESILMCDFISIAVPTRGTNIMSQWRRRKYALRPQDNPSLKRQLPADFSTWVLTTGGCSCDLCPRPNPEEAFDADEECVSLREDAVEIIREIASGFQQMFLYIHYYSGNISTEHLPAQRKERRNIDTLDVHPMIRRDMLMELTRVRKR